MSRANRNSKQTVFTRYMFVVALFILWIGAIGVRLVYLQVNSHTQFRQQVLDQRQYVVESKALRGTILDRNGRPLAMSIKARSLSVDPLMVENVGETSKALGSVLGINSREIAAKINAEKKKGRRFLWVSRKLNAETEAAVNAKIIGAVNVETGEKTFSGFRWVTEQKRSYPYGETAANVIGFANSEDKGQAGIELSLEAELRGENVTTVKERDRLGRIYDEWGHEEPAPNDVVLTIDSAIQQNVEEALAAGARAADVKSGQAIVLDPKTGEILAMANYPSFNPNDSKGLEDGSWKNGAIQDNFSPGSIFKLITYSAALEENLIQPQGEIDCGDGTITVAQHTFTDSHAVGRVTYSRAFAESSNVGAIKTAMKVGKNSFYKYARAFGFGELTGVQLPAETNGVLRDPSTWNGDSLASMSIGYEIGVSALQSAAAFATIANDGVRIQPRIVKEIRKSDGESVTTIEPAKRQVVRTETAQSLRKMMQEVVVDGTATKAQLTGYTSAGKTGTAWKYDSKLKAINRNKYVASFIGYAPAENPKVVIAVVMDEPRGTFKYGGDVAAPVFKNIAEQVLPTLEVIPDRPLEDSTVAKKDEIEAESTPIRAKARMKLTGDSKPISNKQIEEKTTSETKNPGNLGRTGEEPRRATKPPSGNPTRAKKTKTEDLAANIDLFRMIINEQRKIET